MIIHMQLKAYFIVLLPPYFTIILHCVWTQTFSNQGQKHVISGRTSDTLGKQSSYLRSAKIEDSTDITFNIKYMELKKLKIFIFVFFTFIVPKFQISFDYNEVLHNIYNMQKKATKSVGNWWSYRQNCENCQS